MVEIIFVLLLASFIIWLAKTHKEIAWVIAIAFILRISATLINLYVVTLPDGGIDSTGFEYYAWDWGQDGLIVANSHFFEKGVTWTYSNLASLVYAIFGRSPLILSSLSVLAGVYCVVLVWKISIQVWGSQSVAKMSAWLVAVYPVLILYSSLIMREVFITLLLLYSMLHVILWSKTRTILNALIAIIAFSAQIILHPGLVTGIVLFSSLLLIYHIKTFFTKIITDSIIDIKSFSIILTSLFILFILYSYSTTLSFPYYSWLQIDNLVHRASVMYSGDAAYPSWLIADNAVQFVLLAIPKFFYFLFSPFPWDISKFKHIIGLLDGLVYIILFISIYSHRRYIKCNSQAIIILLFAIFFILIFSIAVGNFGTGLRHRSKLLPVIIVIAAPFIYQVLFSRRNK
jgi:hypothetical protein